MKTALLCKRKHPCIPDVKAPDIRDFFSRMRVQVQEDRSNWRSGVLRIDPNEKVDPRLAELMEGR